MGCLVSCAVVWLGGGRMSSQDQQIVSEVLGSDSWFQFWIQFHVGNTAGFVKLSRRTQNFFIF